MKTFQGCQLIAPEDLHWRPSNLMEIPNADYLERTGSEHMGARLWRLPPKSANTLHKHIHSEEFYFVLEGTGRMRVGDETLTVPKYGGVLVGPEQLRQVFNDTDHAVLWLIIGAPEELEFLQGSKSKMDLSLIYPVDPKQLPNELAGVEWPPQKSDSLTEISMTDPQKQNAKTNVEAARPPLPPFTKESALQKVRLAEDAWNTREPQKVALAYTIDSRWRNRAEFPNGREEIIQFLTRKWTRELDYRLIKELWMFEGNRIAVRFAYEWHDDSGQWFRSYGNENWEFAENGLMRWRFASINDLPIKESERKYHWPLGRRPDGHPGLSDLGL